MQMPCFWYASPSPAPASKPLSSVSHLVFFELCAGHEHRRDDLERAADHAALVGAGVLHKHHPRLIEQLLPRLRCSEEVCAIEKTRNATTTTTITTTTTNTATTVERHGTRALNLSTNHLLTLDILSQVSTRSGSKSNGWCFPPPAEDTRTCFHLAIGYIT